MAAHRKSFPALREANCSPVNKRRMRVTGRAGGAYHGTSTWLRKSVLKWFGNCGRCFPWRKARLSLYRRIITEVLLQRTQAEAVARFFDNFMEEFPGWPALARASTRRIGAVIKPIGLWRRRAKSLSALASVMARRRGRFPKTREAIEELPGVGQYIANAILLFAWDQPEPLLDVNMARVLERFFGPRALVDIRFDPGLQALARDVVQGSRAVEVNWAILDLAAMICRTRNPRCEECPLRFRCRRFGV